MIGSEPQRGEMFVAKNDLKARKPSMGGNILVFLWSNPFLKPTTHLLQRLVVFFLLVSNFLI